MKKNNRLLALLLVFSAFIAYRISFGSLCGTGVGFEQALASPVGHSSSSPGEEIIIPFMLDIVLILLAAKIGGEIFERMKQPPVLGELIVGVFLGNLHLIGFTFLEELKSNIGIGIASQIGVILLLFLVGLESRLKDMISVGLSSAVVAIIGVVSPMFLGFAVGQILLKDHSFYGHLFLGATLCATSVGITARVMTDLKKTGNRESKIILGAAVIDDVLGLIVLAVVGGMIAAAASGNLAGISALAIMRIIGTAVAFLVGAIFIGSFFSPVYMSFLSRLRLKGALTTGAISLCFIMSAIAGLSGLAPIIGAFAAGLVLEPSHYKKFTKRGEPSVEHLVEPIADIFVPVFFVVMGLHVDLRSFLNPQALLLALVLTVVAVVGKLVCGYGIFEKKINRLIVGVGMVPRGEVGLIFANYGKNLTIAGERIVTSEIYSALVVMIILTTFLTPIWLKSLFTKDDKRSPEHNVPLKST